MAIPSSPHASDAIATAHTSRSHDRWWALVAALVTAGLAVAAYAPTLHNEFVYDDWPVIATNPNVTTPGPWYRAWREPYWPRGASIDKLYRPLTIASFRANVVFSGTAQPDPVAFRIVNILLHALTTAGVAVLAYRISGRMPAAWVAGALFATHPVHTEAVVTGYGRAEVLAGLLSVWILVRHVRPAWAPPPRTAKFHIVSAVLFLAAIMSKEHAMFVWPAVLLIDLWPSDAARKMPWRERLNKVLGPSHAAFVLAIATYFVLRCMVFGQFYRLDPHRVRPWENPIGHATLLEHVLTPLRLLWLTLELMFNPDRLVPIWSAPTLSLAGHLAPDVLAGGLLLALVLLLMVVAYRRRWPLGALLGGLLLLLAIPVQALPMAQWFYAERWLYLPTVLIASLAAAGLVRIRGLGPVLGIAAALVLLPATWSYGAAFKDNLSMNLLTVRRQPDNFQARRNIAAVLCSLKDYTAAIEAANEVIERFPPASFPRFPEPSDPYDILVRSYLALGDGRQALAALDKYEYIRRDIPEPSRVEERKMAQELIARAASRPPVRTSTSDPG